MPHAAHPSAPQKPTQIPFLMPLCFVLLFLVVALGGVLKFLHSLPQTPHQLWDFLAAKQEDDDEQDQNDLHGSWGHDLGIWVAIWHKIR